MFFNLTRNFEFPNFFNLLTFAQENSKFSCTNSLYINVLGLSEFYKRVLVNNGAFVYSNSEFFEEIVNKFCLDLENKN